MWDKGWRSVDEARVVGPESPTEVGGGSVCGLGTLLTEENEGCRLWGPSRFRRPKTNVGR